MMLCTVAGGRGFIGSHLARELLRRGHEVRVPAREERLIGPLGHVFYCAGVTADFRTAPYRTARAHVTDLVPLLESAEFESLTYLSSTRVYGLAPADTHEDAPLRIRTGDKDHLYNASKALGESLALSSGRPVRVLRLSNVYGLDLAFGNFIAQVLRDILGPNRRVLLRTALESEKDYVSVNEVVEAIIALTIRRAFGLFNVASGRNTSHRQIADALRAETGSAVDVAPEAPAIRFPVIDVQRLRAAIPWEPSLVAAQLGTLAREYADAMAQGS
jgi:nucleoside-diphosphate-sugar epimerase